MQMKAPQESHTDLSDYLKNHSRIGIKGGRERETFLEIWMVEVDNRFFARSWNKSKKSWFTDFVSTGVGQVKCGEIVLNLKGEKVSANDPVQEHINHAYLEKYNTEENLFYSRGITQPEYANYTMEFFIDQK